MSLLKKNLIDAMNKINSGNSSDQSQNLEVVSIMEYLRTKRHLSLLPQVSKVRLMLWQLLTFLSITFYRWLQVHQLKKSSTYFLGIWIENVVVVCLIYLFMRRSIFQKYPAGKLFQYMFHAIVLHVVLTFVDSVDFNTLTRKSSGTEFYQFKLVLSPLLLLVVIYGFYIAEISSYLKHAIGLFTCWKLMILFQDVEFDLSFSTSIFAVLVTVCYGFYWLLLQDKLNGASALEVILLTSVSTVGMFPLLMVANYQNPSPQSWSSGITLMGLLKIVLMSVLKIVSFSSTLVLLKQSDPLTTMLTINLAFIPDNFIQALVYKLDCTLSAGKVCIIIGIEFIFANIKNLLCDTDSLDSH